jgi:GNAT superfamily N-acetyltransferase
MRALQATGRPAPPEGLAVEVSAEPGAQWLATYKYRGSDLPAQARALLLSAPEQAFFSIRTAPSGQATLSIPSTRGDPHDTVAVARGSLAGGWGCVTAVDVAPDYRRMGLARVLLGAVAGWAADRGATSMFLQVAAANEPAHRLYRSAGFTVHHRYDYLTPS